MLWDPIDGETPIDPSELKDKAIVNRKQLNIAEAENIRKVVVRYLSVKPTRKLAPFDYGWALQLHEEMYGDVWNWAGRIRSTDGLNLGIRCHAIPENLALLFDDLANWSNWRMDLLEQATRLHHRAVHIHPFNNGNGRWSRMLANIWLRLNDHPIVIWPEAVIGNASEIRDDYIAAIRLADEGDYTPLIALHRKFVETDGS